VAEGFVDVRYRRLGGEGWPVILVRESTATGKPYQNERGEIQCFTLPSDTGGSSIPFCMKPMKFRQQFNREEKS
jgi:hypothetical protein